MSRRCVAVWALGLLTVVGCVRGGRPRASVDGGEPLDAGTSEVDASTPSDAGTPIDAPSADTGAPPPDAGPEVDAYVPPPVDGGPTPGTGAYLDRCTVDSDCASTRCVPDLGGTRFCTRTCTAESQCADEHLCVGGACVPDDTGKACAVPEACSTTLCLGSGGDGQCTRDCGSAADCPAGYACTTFDASGRRVCIDIEKPCTASGTECRSGLCDPTLGCSAQCRTAADCPSRLAISDFASAPYTCEDMGALGRVCVPPADVIASDPIGQYCAPSGSVYCRSGLCLSDAVPTAMCSQGCTSTGNCAPGYGCVPDVFTGAFGSSVATACLRAGSADLASECSSARQCESALCIPPSGPSPVTGRCTRLCMDGICPTGWACTPFASGSPIRLCVPPS